MLPLSYVADAKKPIAMLSRAMTGSKYDAPFPSHWTASWSAISEDAVRVCMITPAEARQTSG